MKNKSFFTTLLAIMLVFGMAFIACDNGNGNDNGDTGGTGGSGGTGGTGGTGGSSNPFVGTWTGSDDGGKTTTTFIFKADMSFTQITGGKSASATYTYSGNTATVSANGKTITCTVSGNTLTCQGTTFTKSNDSTGSGGNLVLDSGWAWTNFFQNGAGDSGGFIFKSDGTVSEISNESGAWKVVASGTYTTSGSNITITGNGASQNYTYSFSGDTLTLTLSGKGIALKKTNVGSL